MSDFQALLNDLDGALAAEEDILAKAQSTDAADDESDDAVIQAAAEGEDDGEDEPGDADTADLAKSFKVTLEDGSEADAFDGEALIKSFRGEIESLRTDVHGSLQQVADALTRSTKLIKSLREQNADLAAQLKTIGAQGRGRKSSLSVHERAMAGDEMRKSDTPQPAEILAKALSAQSAGRITSVEVAQIDAHLARGLSVPEPLLAKLGGLN